MSFVRDLDSDAFVKNEEKMFAVIRALEIIGEAAKHIPPAVRRNYPDIPWQKIAGTRDKLIHAYFDIHGERLWVTVQQDLPSLRRSLEKILQDWEK